MMHGMSTRPFIIEIVHLTKRFGDLVAADDISLAIWTGEIFGLIGPNGAGKSTLVKMLTTLLPPTSGTAQIAGFDIRRQPAEVRRRIGYVPQLLSADGSLTGYEIFCFRRGSMLCRGASGKPGSLRPSP